MPFCYNNEIFLRTIIGKDHAVGKSISVSKKMGLELRYKLETLK